MTTLADPDLIDLTKMSPDELCGVLLEFPSSRSEIVAELERRCSPPADVRAARVPADDGEPVTPEWIETQGWRYTRHPGPGYRVWLPTGQSLDWRFGGCWIGEVPIALTMSRGQIRRLCAALGVAGLGRTGGASP